MEVDISYMKYELKLENEQEERERLADATKDPRYPNGQRVIFDDHYSEEATMQANISLTLVTMIVYLINMYDAFIVKEMAYYKTMTETNYPASLASGSTNYWTLANTSLWSIRGVVGLAFIFQSMAA